MKLSELISAAERIDEIRGDVAAMQAATAVMLQVTYTDRDGDEDYRDTVTIEGPELGPFLAPHIAKHQAEAAALEAKLKTEHDITLEKEGS